MARATISDVAARAGVHPATVSRALNSETAHLVNVQTARRVRKAAEEIGYVANVAARSLRTRRSMTVGVLVPDLTNPLFPPIVRGIESVLSPAGYTSLISNTDNSAATEMSALSTLRERQVDGLIVATGYTESQSDDDPSRGIPVIMVNRGTADGAHPLVTADNAGGIDALVDHLLSLGHRHILHMSGPLSYTTSRQRADRFIQRVSGLGWTPRTMELSSLSIAAGAAAMDSVLAAGRSTWPTAIMAGNDLVALGALRSIKDHGLRCPDDMSVTGFNDIPFAADFSPPLTTVGFRQFEMGAEAARLLLSAIRGKPTSAGSVIMPIELKIRMSTAAPV